MERQVQSPALIMRVVKYAFVVSGFLFVYIAFKVLAPPTHPTSQTIEFASAFMGLSCIMGGFFLPGILFRGVESRSQNATADARLQRWMAKGIMSLAYFEASILLGFALRVLGGRTIFVGLLMGAGIAAELVWSPGTPPGAEGREFPQI